METNLSGTLSYTTTANHLSTTVSELPEYVNINRSVSAVSTVGGDQYGAYTADGPISTEYIPNWRSLSKADKKKFIAERKRQGVKLGDGNRSKTGNDMDDIKELKKKNLNFKKKIKALKKKVTNNNDEGYDND